MSDLDTTVMFAATGTLQPETEGDSFGDHRFVTAMSVKKNAGEFRPRPHVSGYF